MNLEPNRESVALFCTTLIAIMFVMSGSAKLTNLRSFVATAVTFELLPHSAARLFGYLLPFVEIALGLFLLLNIYRTVLLGFAVVVLLTFSLGIALNLIRGRTDISCGCFGSLRESRLTWFMVIRNILMIGIAWFGSATSTGSVPLGERALVTLTVASLFASYYLYGLIVKLWQPRF
jgi:uncharacterized membrane protein YphA (DoxX/SURF4 family)